MKKYFSLKNIAGAFSVIALGAVSVSPDTFQIPISLRPWIFIFTIAWTLLLASGVFS
ncbi:MAG: hypothetical protein U0V18_07010 [Anaerolineales bacterium]